MKNVPTAIYLTTGEAWESGGKDFKQLREVSWAEERTNPSDEQYVNVAALIRRMRRAEKLVSADGTTAITYNDFVKVIKVLAKKGEVKAEPESRDAQWHHDAKAVSAIGFIAGIDVEWGMKVMHQGFGQPVVEGILFGVRIAEGLVQSKFVVKTGSGTEHSFYPNDLRYYVLMENRWYSYEQMEERFKL